MLNPGLEEATQGMVAMRAMEDVVANNLANANTPGFQEDAVQVFNFGQMFTAAIGEATPAGYVPAGGGLTGNVHLLYKSVTKFTQGQLKNTHQPFDFALEGKGFFTVKSREGIHYTRNGNFNINSEGFLVNKEGSFVLGEHGPIKIKGSNFKLKEDGSVVVNGKTLDRLRICWIDPKEASKIGNSDFTTINPMVWPAAERPKIKQGYLEMSTVNPIKEMVHMMTIMRSFEASSKLLQAEDQMTSKSNQVGQPK